MKTAPAFTFLKHVLPDYIQAITTYSEKPDEVSAVDLFWVITELIDNIQHEEISLNISRQLKNKYQHDEEYQWALSVIDMGWNNKLKILNGKLRSLTEEKVYCQAMNSNPNASKLERSTSSSDLRTFETIDNILAKIRQTDYLELAGQRYTANLNRFLIIALPLEYYVSYTRQRLKKLLIKLNARLAETKTAIYKSAETKILECVQHDINACLNLQINIHELNLNLDDYLKAAQQLPHTNIFFQTLGALGKWTITAKYVNEAVAIVKKMVEMRGYYGIAIESVCPSEEPAKNLSLTPL